MKRRCAIKRHPKPTTEVEYLKWIRTLPCLVCHTRHPPLEQTQESDPAHFATPEGPRAGIAPLCPSHHRRKDAGGGPDSHHELGKDFWTHHFGPFASAEQWAKFYHEMYLTRDRRQEKAS